MKYVFCTLGCKVNQFETQAMEKLLQEHGLVPAENDRSDVIIVNSCAVTAESVRKSRQAVRRLQKQHPSALTVVCGCFSQISPDDASSLGADIVYGSGDRKKLVEDILSALEERQKIVFVDDPFKRRVFEPLVAGAVEGRTRAMIKIQDGCDNFCTYCIIPYARGRVRSLPVQEISAQCALLAEEGFREIVVTGIEIASYGKDLRDGTTLADAIAAAAAAAPNVRIHIGSIEPTVITEAFCARLASLGNIIPHFHLSVQSGSDEVLRRMNRKYDTSRLLQAAADLRRFFPGCALTADLITGFPGETPEQHAETLETIRKCGFSQMHIFPYSVREGTKAAAMSGQLTAAEKERRAREARIIAEEMKSDYLHSCVGKTLSVLFETEEGGFSFGHAENYCEVCVSGTNLRGIVQNVQITGISGETLVGNAV